MRRFEQPRQGGIWLAKLRQDGFVYLDAEDAGEFWTQPANFTGGRLLLNSWGFTGARAAVEIADLDGHPLPGFALEDCDGLAGEQCWSAMTWKGSADVSAVAGRTVRPRFVLNRIRLYGFRFA